MNGDHSDGPIGDLSALGPLIPDNAHQPSLAYVPYLISGTRFYADEMKFWANYDIISSWPGNYNSSRQCGQGLMQMNQVRGFGWTLRNMSDAAAYVPDNDPFKPYMANIVRNNLSWLDQNSQTSPLGVGMAWIDKRPENQGSSKVVIADWEQNYLAWAIDHANQQGFQGGQLHRDAQARWQFSLFQDTNYRAYAGSYTINVGTRDSQGIPTMFTTWQQLYQANGWVAGGQAEFRGYYGVDARLMLMIARKNAWTGAQGAYDYLFQIIGGSDPNYYNGASDISLRSGWAIAYDGEP